MHHPLPTQRSFSMINLFFTMVLAESQRHEKRTQLVFEPCLLRVLSRRMISLVGTKYLACLKNNIPHEGARAVQQKQSTSPIVAISRKSSAHRHLASLLVHSSL